MASSQKAIESKVVDTDEPLHTILNSPEGNPHLERALDKWRQQVEDGVEKTISAFGSSVC
jgi:hypothetical protein